ncbi:unnamed protein product [Cochlearia groenlandica]
MKLCYISFIIFGLIVLQFLTMSTIVTAQQDRDTCNSTIPLKGLNFDIGLLQCIEAWTIQNFILRYAKTAENTWSFILSAPDSSSYIGMGFSTNGRMVGSSAMVGWVSSDNGIGITKQYLLGGQSPGKVIPDQGDLKIINGSFKIESVSPRLYMSFQLTAELPREKLLYAIGPDGFFPSSSDFMLRQHRFMTTMTINYNKGQDTSGPTMSPPSPTTTETSSRPSPPSSAYGLSPSLLLFGISLIALKFY